MELNPYFDTVPYIFLYKFNIQIIKNYIIKQNINIQPFLSLINLNIYSFSIYI